MNENIVGEVKVNVSPKAIHKAVQNVIYNELKIDPIEIRKEVVSKAEEIIRKEIIDYISKTGYNQAQLYDRVNSAIGSRLQQLESIVREVARQEFHRWIDKEISEIVATIVTKGLEINLNYNWKKPKIKITTDNKENTNAG